MLGGASPIPSYFGLVLYFFATPLTALPVVPPAADRRLISPIATATYFHRYPTSANNTRYVHLYNFAKQREID